MIIQKYLKSAPDTPSTFEIGSFVLLKYPERPPTKLSCIWSGPLIVVNKRDRTFECQDLNTLKTQWYDISRLKAYQHGPASISNSEAAARDTFEFEVEEILAHTGTKSKKSQMRFLVRWAGYDETYDTWEPYANLSKTEALQRYSDKLKIGL